MCLGIVDNVYFCCNFYILIYIMRINQQNFDTQLIYCTIIHVYDEQYLTLNLLCVFADDHLQLKLFTHY